MPLRTLHMEMEFAANLEVRHAGRVLYVVCQPSSVWEQLQKSSPTLQIYVDGDGYRIHILQNRGCLLHRAGAGVVG